MSRSLSSSGRMSHTRYRSIETGMFGPATDEYLSEFEIDDDNHMIPYGFGDLTLGAHHDMKNSEHSKGRAHREQEVASPIPLSINSTKSMYLHTIFNIVLAFIAFLFVQSLILDSHAPRNATPGNVYTEQGLLQNRTSKRTFQTTLRIFDRQQKRAHKFSSSFDRLMDLYEDVAMIFPPNHDSVLLAQSLRTAQNLFRTGALDITTALKPGDFQENLEILTGNNNKVHGAISEAFAGLGRCLNIQQKKSPKNELKRLHEDIKKLHGGGLNYTYGASLQVVHDWVDSSWVGEYTGQITSLDENLKFLESNIDDFEGFVKGNNKAMSEQRLDRAKEKAARDNHPKVVEGTLKDTWNSEEERVLECQLVQFDRLKKLIPDIRKYLQKALQRLGKLRSRREEDLKIVSEEAREVDLDHASPVLVKAESRFGSHEERLISVYHDFLKIERSKVIDPCSTHPYERSDE